VTFEAMKMGKLSLVRPSNNPSLRETFTLKIIQVTYELPVNYN